MGSAHSHDRRDEIVNASINAPAKLTLSLRITGVRNDGYHLIDAIMTTLDLADELSIDPSVAPSRLDVDGPFAEGVPTTSDNLVLRALALVGRTAAVRLTKNIPHGGGLGGGSADAAAVLRWAGHNDPIAASRLGADIPFCVAGGRARVRGIGELIDPLAHEPNYFTLVVPPLSVSTPAVYRAWDALGGPTSEREHHPNDLEPAAFAVEPQLVVWRDRIREACGEMPILAGSGATWFVPGRHDVVDALAPARVVVTEGC
jgi:4-diphosphocytidyl-2-C-methyl-D-erythritol kinase